MNIGVCIIVKEENKYLDEFVDHYLNTVGVDHIYIYDHNDVDGEHIKDYGDKVTIIDFRGHAKPCQQLAYEECYYNYGNECDFIMFIDADEFLCIPETDNDIHKFLSLDKFKDADVITLNWVLMSDGNQVYYEDKPLAERFKGCELWDHKDNLHRKNIVKTKLGKIKYKCPHVPFLLEKKNPVYISQAGYKTIPAYGNTDFEKHNKFAYLKHYNTKTLEEFINYKLKRGFPDQEGIPWKSKAEAVLKYFFSINEKTPEKIEYLKSQGLYEDSGLSDS